MKLARIFLLAALSIAAFAQELPKNLDIIYAKYNNEGIYGRWQAGPRTSGIWVGVFLDEGIYSVEITLRYEAPSNRGTPTSRVATQIVGRHYSFSSWVGTCFPVGEAEMLSITATALVATESNTISSGS